MNMIRSAEERLALMRRLTDLSLPNKWYIRKEKRTVIYHYGPPNSGKTHSAKQEFYRAKRAIYCCPLRLLANEIADEANEQGIPCDMITGEEVRLVNPDQYADHVACTIHMTESETRFNLAILDEVQMIADAQHGASFTRALLSIRAKVLHVCGEKSACDLIRRIVEPLGDTFQTMEHTAANKLLIELEPLGSFHNVHKGDCIVCFSKKKIRSVSAELERIGVRTARLYGSLPPETKRIQSSMFNDKIDNRNVLVATDAIGIGMNLAIRRVVFYSIKKFSRKEETFRNLTPSELRQIAGRAGRYNHTQEHGYYTAYSQENLDMIDAISKNPISSHSKACVRPLKKSIEEFAALTHETNPSAGLFDIIQSFLGMAKINNELYFLDNMEDVLFAAELLQGIKMSISDKYVFCTAPVTQRCEIQVQIYLEMATWYSQNKTITAYWMRARMNSLGNLTQPATFMTDLDLFEDVYATLGLYIWLNNKFDENFPDHDGVMEFRNAIVVMINDAVERMHDLIDLDDLNITAQGPGARGGRGGRGRGGRGRGGRRGNYW